MKTILIVIYDDVTSIVTTRIVQGDKFGEPIMDMSSGEINAIKNLLKKLAPIWKIKTKKVTQ